jgi:hypothetical protein
MATAMGIVAVDQSVTVVWMVRAAQAWNWCGKDGMGGSK